MSYKVGQAQGTRDSELRGRAAISTPNGGGHPLDRVHHALPLQAAMAGQIVNTTIITAVLFQPSHALAFSLWALVSAGVAAFILIDWTRRAQTRLPRLTSPRFQRRALQWTSLLGGMWALLSLALLGDLRPSEELMLIAVLICTCSSGAVLLSAMHRSAIAYASLILLPTVAKCYFVLPTSEYAGLGSLLLAYWGFLMGLIRIWSRLIASKAAAIQELQHTIKDRDQIEEIASTDPVTGLANRRRANQILSDFEARRVAGQEPHYALLFIDFDRFKTINDTLGRDVGDLLLRDVGKRLSHALGPRGLVARLGGDEFAVLAPDVISLQIAERFGDEILGVFDHVFQIGEHQVPLTACVGIAHSAQIKPGGSTLADLADMALASAKADGLSSARIYDEQMSVALQEHAALDAELRSVILRDELFLEYQPIYGLGGHDLVGLEALLRWRRGGAVVSPATFIPIAESNGMIVPIGAWVLRQACMDARNWPSHLRLAVNLSAIQIYAPRLVETVAAILDETGFPAERLDVELTESILLKNRDITLTRLQQLKALGIKLVMDDFGTGYSSLGYIHKYPIDKIKIDRSFLAALGGTDQNLGVITAIVMLARTMGLEVTAEGIESEHHLALLGAFAGIDGQGYHLGRPQEIGALERVIARAGERHSASATFAACA